jgi:hypothetical protein
MICMPDVSGGHDKSTDGRGCLDKQANGSVKGEAGGPGWVESSKRDDDDVVGEWVQLRMMVRGWLARATCQCPDGATRPLEAARWLAAGLVLCRQRCNKV